jgi:hypothetical protein
MLKDKISTWFYQAVEESQHKYELKQAILKKPLHVKEFEQSLISNVLEATPIAARKIGQDIKTENLKSLVYDLTNIYLNGIEKEAQRRIQSDIARAIEARKKQDLEDLDKTVSGTPSGEFKEYIKDGLILDETIIGSRQ